MHEANNFLQCLYVVKLEERQDAYGYKIHIFKMAAALHNVD